MDQHARAEYVELWARVMEGQGQTRIAGRIYGYLTTAEAPYLSLSELADALGVSRASISTNSRRLIDAGMLRRAALPGSRGQHYAIEVDAIQALLVRAAQAARAMQALATQGLALQPRVLTPGTQGLRQMVDVFGEVGASLEQYATRAPGRAPASKRAAR